MAAENLQAQLAARQVQERARRAVLAAYDFTGNMRDRVRCAEVSQLIAETLEIPRSAVTGRMARKIARAAGAMFMRPGGFHFLARMRPRDKELVPGDGLPMASNQHSVAGAMRRAWWARLYEEGLDAEQANGAMRDLPHYREYARDINVAFFDKARRDYWKRREELDIWGLYALEGLSVREVAAKTGKSKWAVHQVVQRMTKGLTGQPTEDEETGADGEGEDTE